MVRLRHYKKQQYHFGGLLQPVIFARFSHVFKISVINPPFYHVGPSCRIGLKYFVACTKRSVWLVQRSLEVLNFSIPSYLNVIVRAFLILAGLSI